MLCTSYTSLQLPGLIAMHQAAFPATIRIINFQAAPSGQDRMELNALSDNR